MPLLLLLLLPVSALALARVSVVAGVGGGDAFFAANGARFQPRGLNYVRLNGTQFEPPATLPVYHATFSPLFYNASAVAGAAAGAAGFFGGSQARL